MQYQLSKTNNSVLRWIFFPILLLISIALFGTNQSKFVAFFPNIAPFSSNKHKHQLEKHVLTRVSDSIPVTSIKDAFALGRIYQRYQDINCLSGYYVELKYNSLMPGSNIQSNIQSKRQILTDNPNYVECNELVERLKTVTNLQVTNITAKDIFFNRDYDNMNLIDYSQTYLQRAAGFLTLTNCAFIIGTILILVAIVPVITLFVGPIIEYLSPIIQKLIPTIKNILMALQPLYELIIYLITFIIITQSVFYHSSVSHFIAFSGGFLGVLAFFYSTFLHLERKGGQEEKFAMVIGIYIAFLFGMPAIIYNSTLLGFITCCGLYTSLGFSIVSYGLCTSIGFSNQDAMERCAVTSLVFLLISIIFPYMNMSDEIRNLFEPFRFGIFSLGGSIYFLATLIISSKFYNNYPNSYMQRQLYFIIPVFSFFAVGNIYSITSLTNSAGTFLFIYGMEKYIEIAWTGKKLFWLMTLFSGVILYWVSLFLKTHPDWILQLFKPL